MRRARLALASMPLAARNATQLSRQLLSEMTRFSKIRYSIRKSSCLKNRSLAAVDVTSKASTASSILITSHARLRHPSWHPVSPLRSRRNYRKTLTKLMWMSTKWTSCQKPLASKFSPPTDTLQTSITTSFEAFETAGGSYGMDLFHHPEEPFSR